jgi:protein gp37
MAENSGIEWTESTWNPVTGCTKISDGCKNCYAARIAHRLRAAGHPRYSAGFKVRTHEDVLLTPLKWKKPRMIFVNSMSDLFHEDVPFEFVLKVFHVMEQSPRHIFQILTKRSNILMDMNVQLPWPRNVWMGVSVESSKYLYRIDELRGTNAKTKFISFEPLLSPIHYVDLTGIDWVIAGGESGPGARPMSGSWVENIRDQCLASKTPFFFKQWGGLNRKKAGRMLGGRTWDDMPEIPMSLFVQL